jgi:hypothetical protein
MLLLKAVLGFMTGAMIGAAIAVVLAGVWFFILYPLFHRVNWDSPGIGFMPVLATPFGAIIGAALGTVLAVRRR